MRKVFKLGVFILALTGCATTGTNNGWAPKDEVQMRQLIGETVMQALVEHCRIHNQQVPTRQLVLPLDERL